MHRNKNVLYCNCNCKRLAVVLCFLFVLGTVCGILIYFRLRNDKVCHPRVGCFDVSGAWQERPRLVNFFPQSPTAINTSFIITSRDPTTGERHSRTIYYPFRYPTVQDFRWGKANLVVFVIHGYTDSSNTWMQTLQEVLLSLGDITIVLVDWNAGAAGSYPQAIANTRVVAREISIFISYLVRREFTGLSPSISRKRFHLIGHSLGAQISSYVGKAIRQPEGTIYQITALDPAYPCFEGYPAEIRLNKKDARHVVVIHSNISPWGFGMKEAVGTVDLYLNNGKDQRGCTPMKSIIKVPLQLGFKTITSDALSHITDLIACSHRRAYEVLEDMLRSLRRPFASKFGRYVAYPMIIAGESDLESAAIKYSYCQAIYDGCWTLTFNKEDYFFNLPKPNPSSFFSQSSTYFMPTADKRPFCSRMGYLEILTCPSKPTSFLDLLDNVEVSIFHVTYGDEVNIYQGRTRGLEKIRAWIDLPCDSVFTAFNSNGKLNIALSVSYKDLSESINKSNTKSTPNTYTKRTRKGYNFCWSEIHLSYYNPLQDEFVKLKPCKSLSAADESLLQQEIIPVEEAAEDILYSNLEDQCFHIEFTSRTKS